MPIILKSFSSQPQPTPIPTTPPPPTLTPTPTLTPEGVVPNDGDWDGTNDQGRSLEFSVTGNGTSIPKFTLRVGWGGACGGVSYTQQYFYDININSSGHFYKGSGESHVSGDFSSSTTASGTYYSVLETFYPSYCKATKSGTWTATYTP